MSWKMSTVPLPLLALLTGCMAAPLGQDTGEGQAEVSAPFILTTGDANGNSETASPTQIDQSTNNAFFHNFGTNGRTCGTCHLATDGWTITPVSARGKKVGDPLFEFDGSDCLPPGVHNTDPVKNSTQMRTYGNVRIDLPIPAGADYHLASVREGAITCPTPPNAADLRMYRRPLPTSNTAFLPTVMWDGRENVNPPNNTTALIFKNLQHQSNDATRGHAQATADIPSSTQTSIVNFEINTFNGQSTVGSLNLKANGGNGGGQFIAQNVLPKFFIGINDTFGPNFTPVVFDIFKAWEPGATPPNSQAAAIGRGEKLFNSKKMQIQNVAGINGNHDALRGSTINGTCGTCHDSPNIGNHSVTLALDIGITSVNPVGGLDISRLPMYLFVRDKCVSGQVNCQVGEVFWTTDGGRGLISGKFDDLGKTKGPILRGLSARAPYFHNGSAPDLQTVVNFYDARFGMLMTPQEKSDLIAFLQAI